MKNLQVGKIGRNSPVTLDGSPYNVACMLDISADCS